MCLQVAARELGTLPGRDLLWAQPSERPREEGLTTHFTDGTAEAAQLIQVGQAPLGRSDSGPRLVLLPTQVPALIGLRRIEVRVEGDIGDPRLRETSQGIPSSLSAAQRLQTSELETGGRALANGSIQP